MRSTIQTAVAMHSLSKKHTAPDTSTLAPTSIAVSAASLATMCLGAAGAGTAVNHGYLLATLALVPLTAWQPTRQRAAIAAAVYFLSLGISIVSLSPYLQMAGAPPAIVLWGVAGCIQSAVWWATWGRRPFVGRTTLALLLTTVPPLGIVSWGHPFHAAGIVFPGAGLAGLALLLVALELIAVALHPRQPSSSYKRIGLGLLAAAVLVSVSLLIASARDTPRGLSSWAGMRTHFGDVFRSDDPLGVMDAVDNALQTNTARIQVWPESTVPHWNESAEAFWSDITATARARGKTIVLGSTITFPDPHRLRLQNVAVIVGAEMQPPVDQRIPVPTGTWHPMSGEGVPLSLFKSATRTIDGKRASFLLCYEQLLSWSYLALLRERPDVLVGLSNHYWTKHTSIPLVQTTTLHSWARLFNIPVVEAVNE